jgi:hypothetical protein
VEFGAARSVAAASSARIAALFTYNKRNVSIKPIGFLDGLAIEDVLLIYVGVAADWRAFS